jgi:hypothetical protein
LIQAEFGDRLPSNSELQAFYERLGLLQTPEINLPVAPEESYDSLQGLRISPLQAGIAAAALSYKGISPSPRIATAVNTPQQGWVVLPALSQPVKVIHSSAANEAALFFIQKGKPYWSHSGLASADGTTVTWLLAGTLPDWQGAPLALVVALEENNIFIAKRIGENILNAAGLNQ